MDGSKELPPRDLELLQSLDTNVSAMVDNFANLVKAARIPEEEDRAAPGKAVPGEMPEVLAEKIILGGKGLLEVVAELKRKAIVSDHESINAQKAQRSREFDKEVADVEAELGALRCEVEQQLRLLEDHFYSSRCKPQAVPLEEPPADLQTLFELAHELTTDK
uniref:Mediator of RNA polymerase II transcription subunit 22 n=1 Tax=Tetraselmis sp. GSL018 TaxID=582737 RepID=A0A061S1Z5_9CHLO|mmetsp:Transcript_15694/g.37279  ORF Transcript_15694/g.37279 Transcript_15694/m.37279 type:complete len:163 (-) Transcript_15694:351-839(-)